MNKYIIILSLLLINLGCTTSDEDGSQHITSVAKLHNEKLTTKYLDSILAEKIYKLKIDAINEYFFNHLLSSTAKKKGISEYELINNFQMENFDTLLELELKNNNYTKVLKEDSITAKSILSTAKYQVRTKGIKSQLLNRTNIQIYLEKDFHHSINGSSLDIPQFIGTDSDNLDVIIVSNYECTYCYAFHKDLKKLIEEYKDIANFRFVYLGNQILKFAKAPIAAHKQGAFNKMNDFIFESVQNGSVSDSLIINYAEKLNLNVQDFINEYSSAELHRKMKKNIEILTEHNIYQTPTLIINNLVYDEPNVLNILIRRLENEKNKY